ncbi:MAG: tetratricopeptide repeat protein [Deltaproteobacteria bacterium]|nr:tetratricopeptide repeat protein [Deltaproteobacteria bacterium]
MPNKITTNPRKYKLIIYIVLAVVTFAVYWQVNQFDFVNFDDNVYVTQNIHIQSGITLDGVRWAFGTKYFDLWHPLIWLSFMLDYQFYGLNAGGYHVTNLILHIMSTLLLFLLFNRMTGAIWKSAFVAALFALHPLHVESVAWIAERKDVLSAFFWMLTLCLYVSYTEKPAIRRYLLVLFSFTCALMSKPMVVTLPVIMILLDYWPLGRFESKKDNLILWQLKEKIPFFVLSAVLVIVTFQAPQNTSLKTLYAPYSKSSLDVFPLFSRIANALVSFVTYLEKTFWPHDLAVFYPFLGHFPFWQVLGSVLLILVISAAVIVMVKRLPYLFFGWLWFAATIFPVIGVIQVGGFSMADRYTYIPLIGIFVMLAWGIPALIKREETRKKILFPAAIAVLTILAVLSWKQCGYWENSIYLLNHSLRVTKYNYLAHNNLASALLEKGKTQEAIYHYDQSIIIAPDYVLAYNNKGVIYAKCGQYQLAIENFNEAIRRKPDYANAYNNRGKVYLNHGDIVSGCSDARKACELGNCSTLYAAAGKGLCR